MENSDWKAASRKDTILAYEKFVKRHRESGLVKVALERIQDLRWQSVRDSGTVTSLERFIRAYPNSRYSGEAMHSRVALLWQDARTDGTRRGYGAFLAQCQDAALAESARYYIAELESEDAWVAIAAGNRLSDYVTFARRFPGSRHLARFDGTVKKVYFVFEPHHVTVHLSEYPHLALKCSIGIAVESGLLARSPTTLGVDMLDAAVSEGKRFHILAVKLRSEEELTILSAKCE